MKRLIWNSLICASACAWTQCAHSAPVIDVLSRPAQQVAHAEKAVLLGASVAGARLVAVGERGIAVFSDDEGRTWRQAQVPVSVTLTAVQMLDARVGYAVGHGGIVLQSADGGQTWRKLIDGIQLAEIAAKAAKTSGDAQALQNAELLVADGADKPLLGLHFSDAQHGMVVGAYNLAFTTLDGGQTWESIANRFDNPKGLHLSAVRSRGNTMVVAGEQGQVYLSDDSGRTFKRLTSPYKGSLFTAELPADNEIVVAGLRGNVWRSTDRGLTWAQVEVAHPVSFVASATRTGKAPLLANQAGQLFELDGGRMTALPRNVSPPLNAVLPLRNGRLLVLGGAGATLLDESVSGAVK